MSTMHLELVDAPVEFSFAFQDLTESKAAQQLEDRLFALQHLIELPEPLVLSFVRKGTRRSAFFARVGDPNGACNVTGEPLEWWGRKFYISPHMTDGEIVQTIFLACKVAQEHELREQFKYKGVAVFDPHYDIEKLVKLHRSGEALKEQEA